MVAFHEIGLGRKFFMALVQRFGQKALTRGQS